MELSDFRETLKLLQEAHNWRPIGDMLTAQMYRSIAGISDDDYLKLVGDFVAIPHQTPAHLLQAIKALRGRLLKESEAAAAPRQRSYADMSPTEQQSYHATIARVKGELADNLAQLYAAGRVPTTKVAGFSSVGQMLAGQTLKRGLDELLLEAELQQDSVGVSADKGDLEWEDAA